MLLRWRSPRLGRALGWPQKLIMDDLKGLKPDWFPTVDFWEWPALWVSYIIGWYIWLDAALDRKSYCQDLHIGCCQLSFHSLFLLETRGLASLLPLMLPMKQNRSELNGEVSWNVLKIEHSPLILLSHYRNYGLREIPCGFAVLIWGGAL